MEYRNIGRTSLKAGAIGLGCVTFGREIDEAASFEIMDEAVERGINFFDTAANYHERASERVIGNWLASRKRRDQIILATKAGGEMTRSALLRSLDESLRGLKADTIDLFQLHHWPKGECPLEETLEALDMAVRSGKVRYVGVSNADAAQVKTALDLQRSHGWAQFESVQPIYNLAHREIEAELIPLCEQDQLGILAYSPLGAGFLTGKYRKGEAVPKGTRFDVIPGHQAVYFSDRNFELVEQLERVANETGISMIQLAMGWALRRPGITTVLVGARHTGHLDQAFEAARLDWPAGLLEKLNALSV